MCKLFISLSLLLYSFVAAAQLKFQVYYLVAASAHYEQDSKKFKEKNFVPYDDLPEAIVSAKTMTRVFQQYGNGKGITILSSEKNRMTRRMILNGLDSLKKKIAADKPANPLIIFYYCGHGISENMAWNQFLIPGNYTWVAGSQPFDQLTKNLIFLGDITDQLSSLQCRYLVLLDCCGKEEKDYSLPEARLRYFFDEKNVETFKTVATVLKILNEYHQADPVIFSIAPGNAAPTVDMPVNEVAVALQADTTLQVGPLCRRSLIALNEIITGNVNGFSLEQFVHTLIRNDFDSGFSPASISYYAKEEDAKKDFIVFSK